MIWKNVLEQVIKVSKETAKEKTIATEFKREETTKAIHVEMLQINQSKTE